MDHKRRMDESQGGVAWEREKAWQLIVAAMDAGDSDALALGWSRYSDAMANGALSAAGAVLIPLDRRIQHLTELFERARSSDLDWRTGESERRAEQSKRIYEELDALGEAVRGLGGLSGQVADHEVRLVALETQGMPANAADNLTQFRADVENRFSRLEFWVVCVVIAIAANALIFLLAISAGGGR